MANGDITSLRLKGKVVLPGGGFKQDGTPTQNKAIVWGELVCTTADAGIALDSYLTGGVGLFGLEELDVISFNALSVAEAAADDKLYLFNLDRGATAKIHHLEDVGQANAKPIDAGDAVTLAFWAIGTALSGDTA
jgi:hypothetical protein